MVGEVNDYTQIRHRKIWLTLVTPPERMVYKVKS